MKIKSSIIDIVCECPEIIAGKKTGRPERAAWDLSLIKKACEKLSGDIEDYVICMEDRGQFLVGTPVENKWVYRTVIRIAPKRFKGTPLQTKINELTILSAGDKRLSYV